MKQHYGHLLLSVSFWPGWRSLPAPILLPATGDGLSQAAAWPLLIGEGLGVLAGLAGMASRQAPAARCEAGGRRQEASGR